VSLSLPLGNLSSIHVASWSAMYPPSLDL
jgi:hypothetical protein